MTSLENKVAIVTGAGSGIGRGMAIAFAAVGARVLAVDLNQESVDETRAVASGHVKPLTANVASGDGASAMIDGALEAWGQIDVLCNNAGIMDGFRLADELDEELWDKVIAVNLKAAYLASRLALRVMLRQGSGVIINTASVAGLRGGRAGLAYTVSKHGVIGLTRSIAATYGEDGIRCNAICPGGVKTQIMANDQGGRSARAERLRSRYAPTQPPRAEPADIANLAVFLASDQAIAINGEEILVDRGWLQW